MSEWPGTCGISQCIIQEDEVAKAIVLIQNDSKMHNHGGGFTNVASYWNPVMFPLTGIYDGWGKIVDIEVDEDDNPHFMLEFFNDALKNKQLVIHADDKEEYCPNDVFGEISELILAIERGVLMFKSIYTGKLMEVTLMLVKNDMYLKALDMMKSGFRHFHDPKFIFEHILSDVRQGEVQIMENSVAKALNKEPRKVCRFINHLRSGGNGHHYFSESSQYNPTKSTEKLAKEAIIFRAFLDAHRKSFAPQLSCGDDFCAYDHLLKWNSEVGRIMKANKKTQDKKYAE